MHNSEIRLIITDFDGTLADTFQANFHAYQSVLAGRGIELTPEQYRACFGLRIEEFAARIGITDMAAIDAIKKAKAAAYPAYFHYIRLNRPLLTFLDACHQQGCPVAVATTARKENIMNILSHFSLERSFDLIISGEHIQNPKPDPECFHAAMRHFDVRPENTLIFEDSAVGLQAAQQSGATYIRISESFYGN